jgi:hypothetical protein
MNESVWKRFARVKNPQLFRGQNRARQACPFLFKLRIAHTPQMPPHHHIGNKNARRTVFATAEHVCNVKDSTIKNAARRFHEIVEARHAERAQLVAQALLARPLILLQAASHS